jgi:hypothetical protein
MGRLGWVKGGKRYKQTAGRLRYPKRREVKGKRPWDLAKSFSIHLDFQDAGIKDVITPFQHLMTLHLTLPAFHDDFWIDKAECSDSKAPFDIPAATFKTP